MAVKLAIVIGADTKAGWPIVKDLLLQDFTVVGLSSSLQSVEWLKTQLRSKYYDAFHTRECDFNSLDAIKTTLLWILQRFPAIAEISIHGHQKNEIDRFINASKTLVECKTVWRRADIIGSAEKENSDRRADIISSAEKESSDRLADIISSAEKENSENIQIEIRQNAVNFI